MKQKALYEISLGTTILLTLLAVTTLIPAAASHANVLGYTSICSWTPWSSLICLGLAGVSCGVRARLFTKKAAAASA